MISSSKGIFHINFAMFMWEVKLLFLILINENNGTSFPLDVFLLFQGAPIWNQDHTWGYVPSKTASAYSAIYLHNAFSKVNNFLNVMLMSFRNVSGQLNVSFRKFWANVQTFFFRKCTLILVYLFCSSLTSPLWQSSVYSL